MTIQELHARIVAGRYADTAHIWHEDGAYRVSDTVLAWAPERVYVGTVGDYRVRHGL